MKHSIFLVWWLLLVSCKKEDRAQHGADFNQSFFLQLHQSAALPNEAHPEVLVTVEGLQDSRCPAPLQCFSAGYILLHVKAQAGTATQRTDLCLGACPATPRIRSTDSTDLDFSGTRYRLYVEGTTPANNSTSQRDADKTMLLRLKRL